MRYALMLKKERRWIGVRRRFGDVREVVWYAGEK
jgi:hypothetical protein